jgi:hemerythrin-like domain-containing protein
MMRAPQLHPLSHEHQRALFLARRLRLAAQGMEDLVPAVDALLAAWNAEIHDHFRREEEVLFLAFAKEAGKDNPLLNRALLEHLTLRTAIHELAAAKEAGEVRAGNVAAIAGALHDHIRFEERELFPLIERTLGANGLDAIKDRL